MSSDTWLDVAGNVADGLLSTLTSVGGARRSESPFTSQQLVVLQEVLKASFTTFAKEVGDVVGMKLAEVNADIRRINNRVLAGICPGEEATRSEATSRVKSNSARSRARNDRRRRLKREYKFERDIAAVKSSDDVPGQF